VAILSRRHNYPRLRHFLDDFGKDHFGGLLLYFSFRHENHDFRNTGAFTGQIEGGRKCLGDPSKSIVGLPDAILFLSILRE
jgi:hypothetical protein